MMERLLPAGVVVVEADDPRMWKEGLLRDEAAALNAGVVETRRRDFTAGRICARRALATLGLDGVPILLGSHGEPLWPANIVGSITHCKDYCAAAVARCEEVLGIGIDAERHVMLPPGVAEMVCTEGERAWIGSAPEADRVHWATVIFSAKESLYKAWFPLTDRWLDFQDAEIVLDPQQRSLFAQVSVLPDLPRLGAIAFGGRFAVADEYVLTAMVVLAVDPSE